MADPTGAGPENRGRCRYARTGRNDCHPLAGSLRQSAFVALAGYEEVNDADRFAEARGRQKRNITPPIDRIW